MQKETRETEVHDKSLNSALRTEYVTKIDKVDKKVGRNARKEASLTNPMPACCGISKSAAHLQTLLLFRQSTLETGQNPALSQATFTCLLSSSYTTLQMTLSPTN